MKFRTVIDICMGMHDFGLVCFGLEYLYIFALLSCVGLCV